MGNIKSKLFKQRLFRLHVAAGISFSLILYISIFFGIFTILLPYIKTWEKPSRHFEKTDIYKIDYNSMIDRVLKDKEFPRNNILINLPGLKGDPALVITHRFAKPVAFNPKTNALLDNEGKTKSSLADFINHLHYGAPLKFFGLIIFGLVSVGSMALVITGIILIILFKFKNQGKSQQAFFSKIHVKVFSWLFVPLFLIILSGAVMNVGLVSSGPMSQLLSKGEAKAIDAVVGTVLFPQPKRVKKLNEEVSMQPINELLKKAKQINSELEFKQIKLVNWYDKSARVEIFGYNPFKPFLNGGIFNKPIITLDAHNGKLIKNQKVLDNVWPVFVAEAIFFLHFLFGIDIISRLFMVFIMSLCCIAIGFGVMLYLEKKAKKFDPKAPFYHWLGKLCLSCMIGIVPATGMLFLTQWVLPFSLEDRVLWQQGIFYNTWLFTLFWAFFRINSYKASKEFFFVGAVLFVLTPIMHLLSLKLMPQDLISMGITNIFAVDVGLFGFGLILFIISIKLPKNRDEAKYFWAKK